MFIKIIIFLASSLVGFGDMFSAAGVWSVADYLEGTRCPDDVGPKANCCASCLNFSPIEYGIFAMPDWFTIPIVLFTSFFVDYFGFGPFGIGIGVVGVIGSLFRLAGSYFYSIHSVSYAFFLVGQIILMTAVPMCVAVRNVAINHFYEQPLKTFVVGASLSLSMLGGFLVFLFGHIFTKAYSLDDFLWLCSMVNLMTPLSCLILYALKSYGGRNIKVETLPKMSSEKVKRELNGTLSKPRSETHSLLEDEEDVFLDAPRKKKRLFDLSGFRAFEPRYWLAVFALSSIKVCTLALGSFSILQQIEVFKISAHKASFNFAMHYGVKVILGPIVGILTSVFQMYGPVCVFGYTLSFVGFSLMTFSSFDPLIGLIFSGIGHVGVYLSLWAVLSEWIPLQHLGLAFSFSMVIICCGISILTTLSGFLRNYVTNQIMAWNILMSLETGIVTIGFILSIILNVIDYRAEKSSLYPKRNKKKEITEESNEETSLLDNSAG